VQVLAVHRRAGLSHLRAEDHANRFHLRAHRERGSQIADHRRDDVAFPASVSLAERGAASQAERCGVDGFLAQRAESLALKRSSAVPHFAPAEEALEPVVGCAGHDHAAEHRALLVARQRGKNRFAPQKAVAGLDELRRSSGEPLVDRHARRRFGHLISPDRTEGSVLPEGVCQHGPQRVSELLNR